MCLGNTLGRDPDSFLKLGSKFYPYQLSSKFEDPNPLKYYLDSQIRLESITHWHPYSHPCRTSRIHVHYCRSNVTIRWLTNTTISNGPILAPPWIHHFPSQFFHQLPLYVKNKFKSSVPLFVEVILILIRSII